MSDTPRAEITHASTTTGRNIETKTDYRITQADGYVRIAMIGGRVIGTDRFDGAGRRLSVKGVRLVFA